MTTKHASRKSITRSFNTAVSGLESHSAFTHRPSSSISSTANLTCNNTTSITNLKTAREPSHSHKMRPQSSLYKP